MLPVRSRSGEFLYICSSQVTLTTNGLAVVVDEDHIACFHQSKVLRYRVLRTTVSLNMLQPQMIVLLSFAEESGFCFTVQNVCIHSGSLTEICPARPAVYPFLAKTRKDSAIFSSIHCRCSPKVGNCGIPGRQTPWEISCSGDLACLFLSLTSTSSIVCVESSGFVGSFDMIYQIGERNEGEEHQTRHASGRERFCSDNKHQASQAWVESLQTLFNHRCSDDIG